MHKIEKEIVDALTAEDISVKASSKDRQGYLEKLVDGGQAMSEEGWAKLSKDAKEWINAGATAHNENQAYPDFPADGVNGHGHEHEDKPKAAKATTSKKKEEVAEAKEPAKRGRKIVSGGEKGIGVIERIRRLVAEDPQIATPDLITKIQSEGYTASKMAIATTKSDFIRSMKLLQEMGHLKGINL